MRRLTICLGALLLAASGCGVDEPTDSPERTMAGDVVNGDLTCSYTKASPFTPKDSTSDLNLNRDAAKTINADTCVSEDESKILLITAQLIAQENDLDKPERLSDLFIMEDTSDFHILTKTIGAKKYTYVWAAFSEVEVGAFFEAGTSNLVGYVSDGNIWGCDRSVNNSGDPLDDPPPLPAESMDVTVGRLTCGPDQAEPFSSSTTASLSKNGQKSYQAVQWANLTALEKYRLYKTAQLIAAQAGDELPGGSAAIFSVVEDGKFYMGPKTPGGNEYTWVRASVGDGVEVGAFFRYATVVGYVSDQDIWGCEYAPIKKNLDNIQ